MKVSWGKYCIKSTSVFLNSTTPRLLISRMDCILLKSQNLYCNLVHCSLLECTSFILGNSKMVSLFWLHHCFLSESSLIWRGFFTWWYLKAHFWEQKMLLFFFSFLFFFLFFSFLFFLVLLFCVWGLFPPVYSKTRFDCFHLA